MNFMHCHTVPATGEINKSMRPLQAAYQAGSWALMNGVHLLGIEDYEKKEAQIHSQCILGNVSQAATRLSPAPAG